MFYLMLVAILCAVVYGVVVGTFSGKEQLWIAPAKVAGGMLVSALICLPSLYIFTCLSGSQARLAEIYGLVMGMLMLTTILLIGFAPVAWLFSQSTDSVNWMGTLHLIFWFIAAFFGLRFLDPLSGLIGAGGQTQTNALSICPGCGAARSRAGLCRRRRPPGEFAVLAGLGSR